MLDRLRALLPGRFGSKAVTLPVVRISGAIGINAPLRPGVSLASVAGPLERAFSIKAAPAVAILINSPGGSPVQSHLIHRRIRALSQEKGKPVLAFVEDVAASGGYMIAVAADEIYADPSSVVGSIGVVSQGFGFVGLIDRLGIERRVHTAGTRKAILDPFRPEQPDDVAHLKTLQADIHEDFRALVRERRGAILSDDPDLFSGLFWTGRTALSLGLVDGLSDLRTLARERFGDEVRLRIMSGERGFPWRRARGLGIEAVVGETLGALEERALWSRYGL